MNKLLIVGAGGHAKSVLDAAISQNEKIQVAFLVDCDETEFYGYPIIGKLSEAEKFVIEYKNIIVAIGDNNFRYQYSQKIYKMGYKLPNVCHRTAYISPFAKIGMGTVVLGNAFVNAGTYIGNACIINTGACIDHDCKIGDGVHISPNSTLCGMVAVGNKTWIGAGCTIIDHITVGRECIVGAGSMVNKQIADKSKAFGVPVKIKCQ